MRRFVFFSLAAMIIVFSVIVDGAAPEKKVAYITIDDGPTLNTPHIIETLRNHNAGAAFFVLKDRIETYPDYIKMMESAGFTVGLHGVSHNGDIYATPTSPLTEMNETNEALYKLVGHRSRVVRTPYGSKPNLTDRQRQLLETAGYKIFDWNVDPRDSIGAVVDRSAVLRNLQSGLEEAGPTAVILLHDRKSTSEALDEILSVVESAGYEFGTLDENTTF